MSPCFSFEAVKYHCPEKSLQQHGGARGFATGAKKPKAPVRPKEHISRSKQNSIDVKYGRTGGLKIVLEVGSVSFEISHDVRS